MNDIVLYERPEVVNGEYIPCSPKEKGATYAIRYAFDENGLIVGVHYAIKDRIK